MDTDPRLAEVAELLASGSSVKVACERTGLARSSWYAAQRRAPAPDVTVPELVPPVEDGEPPSYDELLRRLDEQSRRGSVRATELLLQHVEPTGAGELPEPVRRALDRARMKRVK
jgi:hypothetical protein